MKHLRKMEEGIAKQIDPHFTKTPETVESIKKLLEFFYIYDQLEHTNHYATICAIYLDPKYFENSNVSMTFQTSVSESTLYRYRKKYLDALKIITEAPYQEIAAALG